VRRGDDGAPEWPHGFSGSITHSGGRVLACAANRDCFASIGVDVETRLTDAVASELAPLVLTPRERQLLASAFADAPAHAGFAVAFSAKESLFKCLYPFARRFMEFDAARVVDVMPTAACSGVVRLELTCDWATPAFARGTRTEATYALSRAGVETLVVLPASGWLQ
jgi:4'-phosphopantetheinyl transferase EntD